MLRDSRDDARASGRGVTLPELLVVLSIISMAVAVSIPLIASAVRSANARAAANGLAVNLKAARMIAVSTNAPVAIQFHTEPHPNCFCTPTYYEYPDRRGTVRHFDMPHGVTIASSTEPVEFQPNGSLPGGAETVLNVDTGPGGPERWVVRSTAAGITEVVKLKEGAP